MHERLIELSSWMMVIGTVRIICAFADYLVAFLDAFRRGPVAPGALSPIRRREFADRRALHCLAVGVGGRTAPHAVAAIVARGRRDTLDTLAGRGFGIDRPVVLLARGRSHCRLIPPDAARFLNPRVSDVALILMGAIQLLIEFATAMRALLLFHQFGVVRDSTAEPSKSELARRARIGRLAIYVSFGFMLLLVRLPVWATYLGLLHDSRLFREFVISNDLQRIKGPAAAYRLTKEEERLRMPPGEDGGGLRHRSNRPFP